MVWNWLRETGGRNLQSSFGLRTWPQANNHRQRLRCSALSVRSICVSPVRPSSKCNSFRSFKTRLGSARKHPCPSSHFWAFGRFKETKASYVLSVLRLIRIIFYIFEIVTVFKAKTGTRKLSEFSFLNHNETNWPQRWWKPRSVLKTSPGLWATEMVSFQWIEEMIRKLIL